MIKKKILTQLTKLTERRVNEKLQEKMVIENEIDNSRLKIVEIQSQLSQEQTLVDGSLELKLTWGRFLEHTLKRIDLLEDHIKMQLDKLEIVRTEILELYQEEKKLEKLKERQEIARIQAENKEELNASDEFNIMNHSVKR